jgi:hypothetical protein
MKLKLSYSITIYFIVIFIIAYIFLNLESIQKHALGFTFYLIIIVIAFYFFLSRYSCNLEIDNNSILHIRYLMPWNKDIGIDLKKYKYLDYGRGFYGFITVRKNGHMNLLRYPHDTIILSEKADFKNNVTILKINLRVGQFNKLLNYLKNTEMLKLTDSNGSGGHFW